jgi:hypothetical protein
MSTKELIQTVIDKVSEEDMEELYRLIQGFVQSRKNGDKQSFMSKLKSIQIDAPADFAANLDLYLSGEKNVESSLR